MSSRRSFLTLVSVALLAASCSSGASEGATSSLPGSIPPPTTATTAPIAAGATAHEPDGLGYALVLTEDWIAVDPRDSDALAGFLDAVTEQVEDSTLFSRAADAIEQGIVEMSLWGFNADEGSQVNVVTAERGPLDSPEVMSDVVIDLYESLGVRVVAAGVVVFPFGDVLRVEGAWSEVAVGVDSQVQYFVFGDEYTYTITITDASPAVEGAVITGFSLLG